jgi:hypothetical protein
VTLLPPITGFVWQSIAPPWPPASPVIPALVSIVTILALFLIFRVCSEPFIRRAAAGFIISGMVLSLIYMLMAATYLKDVDGRVHLTGFTLTSEAKQAVDDPKGPRNTPKDLLGYFGYDSEDRIWTGRNWLMWLFLTLSSLASALVSGGLSLLVVANVVNQRLSAASAAGS